MTSTSLRTGARLHITGIVQGVGFRPFIYNLARRWGLTGWVRNTTAGVDIAVDGAPESLQAFADAIRAEAPPLSRIESMDVKRGEADGFVRFEILGSERLPDAFQPISPDVAICDDCLRELREPSDRRFRYPFINCTNCGPRFTIIQDIPYDRPLTTMSRFKMCPDCAREYADPADRRFHAQPVACPACGPQIWLELPARGSREGVDRGEAALQHARRLLAEGRILAVKGLGGFHLACDATNELAVAELRKRKLRVDKPFALMFPDLQAVQSACLVDQSEMALLNSVARPIVLLRRRPTGGMSRNVAPGQDWLGVMLPYTPLHHLLLERAEGFPQALVMTSGNVSEEPIATDNAEARDRLSGLADAFLMHDRDIYVRCDDSVVRVLPEDMHNEEHGAAASVYPLRRSRGYVPFPVKLPWSAAPLLAVGAELKNTFCITNERYAFLSQHVGDMENYETLQSFGQGVGHLERLFRVTPRVIAHDLHPDYLSTRYAVKRAHAAGLETVAVQHHHAHVAACMAEHGLDGSRPVIGVALDGTGYGEDGAIWGGEFLLADYLNWRRRLHLQYFPLPGGDAATRNPYRIALALLWHLGLDWDDRLAPVKRVSGVEREVLRSQLERRLNTRETSSMGRLFDAAASLVGVRQSVNYEAQAAIELEALAEPSESSAYPSEILGDEVLVAPGIRALVADVLAGVPAPIVSARFHHGIAAVVAAVAVKLRAEEGVDEVVLSGGVWQNITLLRRTLSLLDHEGLRVYLHREVPTNDGGLALGQAAVASARLR